MISQDRWQRYRRESILFAVVWLVLGLGTLMFGNLNQSAQAHATAWAMATGPVPLVACVVGVAGALYMARTSFSDSFGSRLALGGCLLGVLMPPYFFAVTYAVVGAKGATAGVLIASTTFAWAGIANLGTVLLTTRQRRRR
jgi:hypothetical protein